MKKKGGGGEKDKGRNQERFGLMEVGSGEQLGSLGGAGGIKNSRAFLMRCYLISD